MFATIINGNTASHEKYVRDETRYHCVGFRQRRRSGSSIVVLDGDLDPVKKPPDDIDDSIDYNMVMMLAGDNGPHREMAVDVPDTFIARNKTPPRYPPPKPTIQVVRFILCVCCIDEFVDSTVTWHNR